MEEFIMEAEEQLRLHENLTRVYVQRTGKSLSVLGRHGTQYALLNRRKLVTIMPMKILLNWVTFNLSRRLIFEFKGDRLHNCKI